jgi:hypothetical protein
VEKPAPSSWRRFLRLWFVLSFAYVATKLIFDVGVMGWVDLRPAAFKELAFVPLGQSVVFWVITRRARKGTAGED